MLEFDRVEDTKYWLKKKGPWPGSTVVYGPDTNAPIVDKSNAVTIPVDVLIVAVPDRIAPLSNEPVTVNTVSAWAMGAAKHKPKTRQSTAQIVLNRLGISPHNSQFLTRDTRAAELYRFRARIANDLRLHRLHRSEMAERFFANQRNHGCNGQNTDRNTVSPQFRRAAHSDCIPHVLLQVFGLN